MIESGLVRKISIDFGGEVIFLIALRLGALSALEAVLESLDVRSIMRQQGARKRRRSAGLRRRLKKI